MQGVIYFKWNMYMLLLNLKQLHLLYAVIIQVGILKLLLKNG